MLLKIHKILIVKILAIFFASYVTAQTAILTGIVSDREGNEPLIAATVMTKNNLGEATDFDGKYTLNLPAGTHKVEFSYVGYQTVQQEITLTEGEVKELNVKLGYETNLLKTATITSGKYEKPLAETTVSLEVVKPRLLESTNSTSVNDLLDKIPGVTMVDDQPNIRGGAGWSYGAGSRVLLLMDDIPVLQADAGLPQWSDLPVENIAQIEVVKGAASALYGSSALNGIINVRTAYATSKPVTKFSTFYTIFDDPKDLGKVWWDSLSYDPDRDRYEKVTNDFADQPREFGFSFAHRQKIKKLDLVLGGFYLNRSSYRERSFARYGRFSVGTRYRISDNLSIGFNSNFNPGKSAGFFLWRDANEGAYRSSSDETSINRSRRFRYTIDPFLTYFDKNGNRHRLTGRFYGINNDNNDNRSNFSDLLYGEYQFQKKWDKRDIVLSAGLVATATFVKAELYGDTIYRSRNLASYVQLDKKFGNKLNLSFGARYEQNRTLSPEIIASGPIQDTIPNGEIVEGKPVFRVGANYELNEGTFLRASWGQGYRYPTIAEQFIYTIAAGLQIVPNPGLESETGWSTEIGIKQGFKISDWNGFIDVAGFWSEYQNMMEFQVAPSFGLGSFQSQNIGDTRIRGLDVSVNGVGEIGKITTFLIAGYTYIQPEYKNFTDIIQLQSSAEENVLKYRSRHNFKVDLEFRYKKFMFGGGVISSSRVEAIDAVLEVYEGIGEYRDNNDHGFTIVDFRTAYEIIDGLKVSFITKNTFNQEYMVRPGTLEAPRSFTLRADYQF
ncbi:MAG: TonB-dependent receptor [Bacteroidota bacterium]